MKRKLYPTSQFKKDLKRYLNQPRKLEALRLLLMRLENGEPVPKENFPHQLHNDFEGCWEW